MHEYFIYWDLRQHLQHKKDFTTFPGVPLVYACGRQWWKLYKIVEYVFGNCREAIYILLRKNTYYDIIGTEGAKKLHTKPRTGRSFFRPTSNPYFKTIDFLQDENSKSYWGWK